MSEAFKNVDDTALAETFATYIKSVQTLAGHAHFEVVVTINSMEGMTTMTHTRDSSRIARILMAAAEDIERRIGSRWVDPPTEH